MVDEFVAVPNVASALQWNIHSWNTFTVDEEARMASSPWLVSATLRQDIFP